MRRLVILLSAAVLATPLCGQSQPDGGRLARPETSLAMRSEIPSSADFNPNIADYRIDVTLDPKTKILTGRERITWTNPSDDTVGELWFHLYLNAFRNTESTFIRESGGSLRNDRMGRSDESWGWIEPKAISTAGIDLLPWAKYVQPDRPDPEDRTVLLVPLPAPVPPRGKIVVDFEFEARLPRVFARTGFSDDFFMVGQWFPKLGVYEPAGMRGRKSGGWNCHQFHAESEFYADFGNYDVTITLPKKFVVAATGTRVSQTTNKDKQTLHYRAERVHDFAWTADPEFKVHRFTFDPVRDVPLAWRQNASRTLGLPDSALQLQPVRITILMQPDHDEQWVRYAEATKKSLAWLGLWLMPYPYPELVIVDPPEKARGAAGMEYPMLVTGMTAKPLDQWPMNGYPLPEIVVVHEIAHQYFYGIVASNEFEEPWLDEGLTSYAEQEIIDAMWGGRPIRFPGGISVSMLAGNRSQVFGGVAVDPVVRKSWEYASERSWGTNNYPKPSLVLKQIENDLGDVRFARALRAYVARWRWRHPSTEDFLTTIEEVAKTDLTPYRRSVFYGIDSFDLAVQSVRSSLVEGRRGFYGEGKDRRIHKPGKSKNRYHSVALIRREGDMELTAEIVFRFENGHVERRWYPARARWARFEFEYGSRLESVVVDPARRNVFDSDVLNNSKRVARRTGRVVAVALKAQTIAARILQALWVFA